MTSGDVSLQIEGMHCGACVGRVEKALRGVRGVTDAAVNLATNTARVTGSADPDDLVTAVEHAGYKASLLAGSSARTLRDVAARGQEQEQHVHDRLRLGFLAGSPVVLIDIFGPRVLERIHSEYGVVELAVTQLLLATVVMLYTGRPFISGAWRALTHRSVNMDVLIALGSGTAHIYSLAILVLEWTSKIPRHAYHLEFHAAVVIVVLVTLGKYLEARAKRRASSAVAGLASQAAALATRVRADGTLETIPAEEIHVGDRLQVLAHQQLPVDGQVIEGAGSLDLSILTGESIPVEIAAGRPGDTWAPMARHLQEARVRELRGPVAPDEGPVFPGGATLADGRIVLAATSTAATSTVAKILELVNAAQASRTQIQSLADRVAAIFVPIILVLGVLNFVAWFLLKHDWQPALLTTIATIVIACPCAMGLATPTAITVAMGRAARLGILFTNAGALESARHIETVIFDKTGTLTEGKFSVSEVLAAGGSQISSQELLQRAASVEQFSEHPLARAVVAKAQEQNLPLTKPGNFRSFAGGGVQGDFPDGSRVAAGSVGFIESLGISVNASEVQPLAARGLTIILVADVHGRNVLGMLALQDMLRAEAAETLKLLRARGYRTGVLSGDSEAAVAGALGNLPVDFIQAGVKPAEKAAAIAELKSKIKNQKSKIPQIAFIGDGINDGPALAAADLGIAMASGNDLAKSAGDVLLMGNKLTTIPQLLQLSRHTLRIIKQNLFWAFAYNVAAIPLAMLGILSPGIAAAAMMLSSLTVVGNALRLHRVTL